MRSRCSSLQVIQCDIRHRHRRPMHRPLLRRAQQVLWRPARLYQALQLRAHLHQIRLCQILLCRTFLSLPLLLRPSR